MNDTRTAPYEVAIAGRGPARLADSRMGPPPGPSGPAPVSAMTRISKEEREQAMPQAGREEQLRRYWDKHARSYDRQMGFFDRHLFAGSREWVCCRAEAQVLEVAIRSGLNLACYPGSVQLTAGDQSPAMLDIARDRAGQLGLAVDLPLGDA